MPKIFIVDAHQNPGLVKFTEAKIFFNAKNQHVDWATDCVVVDHADQISDKEGIIINSGDCVTTNFRNRYQHVDSLLDCRGDPDLIQFTPDYSYSYTKKPPYEPGTKQLYILENLYKTVLRSKKLVYLENTEPYTKIDCAAKHFYGLASGWKSLQYVKDLGIKNFETITIYDICERQLEYQKYLHGCSTLPDQINIENPVCGTYNPDEDIKQFWPIWHSTAVQFCILDLYDTPKFPDNSFVWISNAFNYEPNIFKFGWTACKKAKENLFLKNKSSILVSN
jgi:hypothetical protein